MGDYYATTPLTPFHNAVGAAFGSFTTFQDVSPAEKPVLFGREVRVGQKLELEAWGEFSTTVTPTLQLGFWIGTAATVLAANAATTTGSGAAAWPWHIKLHALVTAIAGTAGALFVQGILDFGTSLTATTGTAIPITAAARTLSGIDLSANKDLGVGAAFSVSNAANTVKTNLLIANLVN